VTMKIRTFLKG